MKEELEIVKKDIENLEKRLRILRAKEEAIRSKIEIPKEWIGKYIMETSFSDTYYMRIDSIERSKNGGFIAEGPAINIRCYLKGIRYTLYSNHLSSIDVNEVLNFCTKEEFNSALENALKNFK